MLEKSLDLPLEPIRDLVQELSLPLATLHLGFVKEKHLPQDEYL
jgi:hypothetical protein